MRHLKIRGKLGRTTSHRKALLRNLATELFRHGQIKTTLAKAKKLRSYAEPLITRAKKGDLHSRRIVAREIKDEEVLRKLFSEIAPRFSDRNGGYLRIVRLGWRAGDSAPLALVQIAYF
jgi:large subunit ribosomal protein L17